MKLKTDLLRWFIPAAPAPGSLWREVPECRVHLDCRRERRCLRLMSKAEMSEHCSRMKAVTPATAGESKAEPLRTPTASAP